MIPIPIRRSDDNELLGFIAKTEHGWDALTIFGLVFAQAHSEDEAKVIVTNKGLEALTGTWHYYDKDDQEWYPCVLKEANEHQVTVIRTDIFGSHDAQSRQVVIRHPTKATLKKYPGI